ncbi:M16 family metallopeptidase [Pseudoalteromonas luteoviolacea]|uniref:M16 family metallopeptidase n=1 Tax=Pseudoalteromonas luteoviolacea TaxID=43657 RepID=UPI0011534004|nr:M16 family metallopeptidase [Pseudoalteromonas luteoviolacea]TQF72606.1 insulinase family protein [Pseudoalteromonas luteoviolacea]
MKKHLKAILISTTLLIGCTNTANIESNKLKVYKPEVIKTQLSNGLTVIAHQDNRAPMVTVNIWYKVGAKDEQAQHSGFAHLFEHLMFTGSEHAPTNHFAAMQSAGAQEVNGTTNHDRTRYFQTIPKGALDYTLWLEAQRMQHLTQALDNKKLETEKQVVLKEYQQRYSNPFNAMMQTLTQAAYPSSHPYHLPPIGNIDDVKSASLDKVTNWFKQYYKPNNAVLVVSGDLDPTHTIEKVKTHFGSVSAGPLPVSYQQLALPNGAKKHLVTTHTLDTQQLLFAWHVPGRNTQYSEAFNLLTKVLNTPSTSYLHKKLVEDLKLAKSISFMHTERLLSSQFVIAAELAPNTTTQQLEKALFEALTELQYVPDMAPALTRATEEYAIEVAKQSDVISGQSGRAHLLAAGEVYYNDPHYYFTRQQKHQGLVWQDLVEVVQTWLHPSKALTISYLPEQLNSPMAESSNIPPAITETPIPTLTSLRSKNIDEQKQLIHLEQPSDTEFALTLSTKSGFLNEPNHLEGITAVLTNALKANAKAQGINLIGYRYAHSTHFSVLAPNQHKNKVMQYLADLKAGEIQLTAPQFKQAKQQVLKHLARLQGDMESTALNEISNHVLSGVSLAPLTGFGRLDTVDALRLTDANEYLHALFNEDLVTYASVGNENIEQKSVYIAPLSTKQTGTKQSPVTHILTNHQHPHTKLHIINKPQMKQTLIVAAHVLNNGVNQVTKTANAIFGSGPASRLNQLIRNEKQWSYGGVTKLTPLTAQHTLFTLMAPVATNSTGAALNELQSLMNNPLSTDLMPKELAQSKRQSRVRFTNLLSNKRNMGLFLALTAEQNIIDTVIDFESTLQDISLQQIPAAMKALTNATNTQWILIGDQAQIEAQLAVSNFKLKL